MIESNSNSVYPATNRRTSHIRLFLLLLTVAAIVSLVVIIVRFAFSDIVVADWSAQPEEGPVGQMREAETVFLIGYPDGWANAENGTVRVLNPLTDHVRKTIPTGVLVDLAVAPNGQHVYVAASEKRGEVLEDTLTAFDTVTWEIIWKTSIRSSSQTDWGRVVYQWGEGPSALLVSPDGRRLFLYEYAGHNSRISILDTATGEKIAESDTLSYCDAAELIMSPDGEWLYLACHGNNKIHFMHTATLQIEETLTNPDAPYATMEEAPPYTPIGGLPGRMAQSVLSLDGRWLYVVTDSLRVALVNVEKQRIERWVKVDGYSYPAVSFGWVALSRDGSKLYVGLRSKGEDSYANELRIFDTESWEQIGQPQHLDGNLLQLATSRTGDHLLLLLWTDNHMHDERSLHVHTEFLVLDPARPDATSPLNLSLSQNEELVRFIVAP